MHRRTSALLVTALIASTLPLSPLSPAAAQTEATDDDIVISAMRTRGPGGAFDEVVELHNLGTTPVDISGWRLQGCAAGSGAPSNRTTVPAGTAPVPPGGFFLFVNPSNDQYSGGTTPDATFTGGIADGSGAGAQMVDTEGERVTGIGAAASECREGDGIGATFPSSAPFTYVRGDDRTRATGDNAVDFDAPTDDVTLFNSTTDPDAPQPVVAECQDLTVVAGQAGSATQTASDADGTVIAAAVTAGEVEGISLGEVDAADAVGGTLSVDLLATEDLDVGVYDLELTFTNDDTEPQSGSCDVTVTVQGDVCETPDDELVAITEIQGPGSATPIAGESVVTRGVVTTAFPSGGETGLPNNHGLRGFFIEAIAEDRDDDPQTSEGLFVFDFAGIYDSELGDLVYVAGTAGESFDVTQVSSDQFATCTDTGVDTTLPPPAELPMPVAPEDRDTVLEPLESMRVTYDELTLVEFFQLERFGEVRVSSGGIFDNPTNVVDPRDDDAYNAIVDVNAANNIILASGRTAQNINRPGPEGTPPLPFLEPGDTLRIGDQLVDRTFVMHYAFNTWRLQPIDIDDLSQDFQKNRTRPRPLTPPDVGDGGLQVASYNVLNYFNGDGQSGGFPTARGALTPSELDRQSQKLVAAVSEIDADIVGLIEMENDGGEFQATQEFVERLNAYGDEVYDFVDTGVIGTDAIKQAFIYKPATVELTGDYAILDNAVDDRFDDQRSRPALAQTFTEIATGEAVTVTVNHFKSKGSGCGGPPDDDPRQGNCNGTRTAAAQALADWMNDDPTGQESVGNLIIGDINAYAEEDPIREIVARGYTDMLKVFAPEGGPVPYSFTFDATQGRLDHALADEDLAPLVTGADEWHINADETQAIDYQEGPGNFRTDEVGEQYYQEGPFRSSDHDPVIIGLDLSEAAPNQPPVVEDLELTTPRNRTVAGHVVASDPDGDTLSYAFGDAANGRVTGGQDGAFTYTPDRGFAGTDAFEVTVTDEAGASTDATVTIEVTRAGGPPSGGPGAGRPPGAGPPPGVGPPSGAGPPSLR